MLMFPFPVTAHGPNATWEREKALPDKTLPGSKCFFIFIIIPKNSNSTHRQFCLVKQMWGRTDAELYFSPHHSFYSAKQTMWKGSNWNLHRPTWTAGIMPTHESNLMQEEEQLSMSKLSTTRTGYSFRGRVQGGPWAHQLLSMCALVVPAGLVQILGSLRECIWCTPEVKH